MIFGWFKRRKRRRIRQVLDLDAWHEELTNCLWQFPRLTADEQTRLCQDAAVLVAEKHWEGCDGQAITLTIKRTVAAQMALLTLGRPTKQGERTFDRVKSILLYPHAYRARTQTPAGGGLVVEGTSERIGEAWYRGPVILSWPDVQAGGRSPNWGRNLVVHEFAHQLDTLNGGHADGVPVIESAERAKRWLRVRHAAYIRLRQACHQDGQPAIDCYGATNHAEFFAVASEVFFQESHHLADCEPQLYETLVDYYGQDPRRWAAE